MDSSTLNSWDSVFHKCGNVHASTTAHFCWQQMLLMYTVPNCKQFPQWKQWEQNHGITQLAENLGDSLIYPFVLDTILLPTLLNRLKIHAILKGLYQQLSSNILIHTNSGADSMITQLRVCPLLPLWQRACWRVCLSLLMCLRLHSSYNDSLGGSRWSSSVQ